MAEGWGEEGCWGSEWRQTKLGLFTDNVSKLKMQGYSLLMK